VSATLLCLVYGRVVREPSAAGFSFSQFVNLCGSFSKLDNLKRALIYIRGFTMTTTLSRIISGSTTETIYTRKLHEFLGVGRDYSNWIKARIKQYSFEENEDYIVCSPKRASKGSGSHNLLDHHITLVMAKELAMVERNEKAEKPAAISLIARSS
jgi:phage anti-repressor protein